MKTMNAIRSTHDWLADVEAKAAEKNVLLEQMIRKDAEYVWEQRLK